MLHELSTASESSSNCQNRLTPYHIIGHLYTTMCCVGFRFGTIQVFSNIPQFMIFDLGCLDIQRDYCDYWRLLEITI